MSPTTCEYRPHRFHLHQEFGFSPEAWEDLGSFPRAPERCQAALENMGLLKTPEQGVGFREVHVVSGDNLTRVRLSYPLLSECVQLFAHPNPVERLGAFITFHSPGHAHIAMQELRKQAVHSQVLGAQLVGSTQQPGYFLPSNVAYPSRPFSNFPVVLGSHQSSEGETINATSNNSSHQRTSAWKSSSNVSYPLNRPPSRST